MLLEALVAIIIVVLCISMLSTAVLTAGRVNKSSNSSETVYVLSGGSTGGSDSSQSGRAEMKFINLESTFDGKAHGSEVKLSWVKVDNVKLQNLSEITVQYKNADGLWTDWTSDTKPTYTDAGKYSVSIRLLVDKNTTYTGSYTLTIQKRGVTLTSASSTVAYVGSEKDPKEEIDIGGDGFIDGDGLDYANCKITGSQTTIGKSYNTFTYALLYTGEHNNDYYSKNYSITEKKGILTVTEASNSSISISNISDVLEQDYTYDGTSHGIAPVFTVASDKDANIHVFYKLTTEDKNAWGDYDPDRFELTDAGSIEVQYYATTDGQDILDGSYTVTVNPRPITLTSGSGEREYDGNELTNKSVTVTSGSFASGDGVEYECTGARTEIGSSENTFTYKLKDGTNPDNYDIKKVYGTLKVTPIAITLTAEDKVKSQFDNDPEWTVTASSETSISLNSLSKTVSIDIGNTTETITYTVDCDHGESQGEYPICVSVPNATVNTDDGTIRVGHCSLTLVPGKLTINQPPYSDEQYRESLKDAAYDLGESISIYRHTIITKTYYDKAKSYSYDGKDDHSSFPDRNKTKTSPVLERSYANPGEVVVWQLVDGGCKDDKDPRDYVFYKFLTDAMEQLDNSGNTSIPIPSTDTSEYGAEYTTPVTISGTVSLERTNKANGAYDNKYTFHLTLSAGSDTQDIDGYINKNVSTVSYNNQSTSEQVYSTSTVTTYYWDKKSSNWKQTGTQTTKDGTYEFYLKTMQTVKFSSSLTTNY